MGFLSRRYGPLTGLGWVLVGSGAAVVGAAVGGVAVLVMIVGFAATSRPQETPPVKPAAPAVDVDAAALHADYAADPAAAAAKYAGKTLRVTLRVDGAQQLGDRLVIRQVFPGLWSEVSASVPVAAADRAAKGSTVTVVGQVSSSGGKTVSLGPCVLRPAGD